MTKCSDIYIVSLFSRLSTSITKLKTLLSLRIAPSLASFEEYTHASRHWKLEGIGTGQRTKGYSADTQEITNQRLANKTLECIHMYSMLSQESFGLGGGRVK